MRPENFTLAAFAGVVLTCCQGAEIDSGVTTVGLGSEGEKHEKHLYVSTHEDDDLLFMTPDIADDIRSGRSVLTIFVTAGDAALTRAPSDREKGILVAYSKMGSGAECSDSTCWSCVDKTVLEKPVHACTLLNPPKAPTQSVSVAFLRIADGRPNGVSHLPSIWAGTSGDDVVAANGSGYTDTYTREELIAVLTQLYVEFAPNRIGTQDPNAGVYGDDHGEHIAASRFAWAADEGYKLPHEMLIFRGYNITREAKNRTSAEQQDAYAIFQAYCKPSWPPGAGDCSNLAYDGWTWRRYAIKSIDSASQVPITGPGGKCLTVQDDHTSVQMWSCADLPQQSWTLSNHRQLIGLGGKCLTIDGTDVVMRACVDSSPLQHFTMLSNGQVRTSSAMCMTAGATQPDGTLLVKEGTPVQILDCAGDGQGPVKGQVFQFRSGRVANWTSNGQFGDEDVGTASSLARSFRLGDIDGDGLDDACIRRPDGVYCAKNQNGSFGRYEQFTRLYSDLLGWGPSRYGQTLMLGDISGDGRADICGRGSLGVLCATATVEGSSFENPTLRTKSFSDAEGYAYDESAYGSIRMGDVNGDGYDDICGRFSMGIRCSLNRRDGTFAAARSWLSGEFTDVQGWNVPRYGATMMLGDVNGDGKADVCGRAQGGIVCATSNGCADHSAHCGFERFHQWSYHTDFSDVEGWGDPSLYSSLRLADVDGDGRADVCGRSRAGVVCAISNGYQFDRSFPLVPQDFTDALGWSYDYYAGTLAFGKLNRDNRADVCGRGEAALLCTLAP